MNDVKCLLASNLFSKAAKDPKARTAADASKLYYLGRIHGRLNATQLKAELLAQQKSDQSEKCRGDHEWLREADGKRDQDDPGRHPTACSEEIGTVAVRSNRNSRRLAPVIALLLAACSGGSDDIAQISAEDLWQKFYEDGDRARERFGDRPLLIEGTADSYSAAGSETPTLWLRVPAGTAPAYLKGPVPLERRQAGERVKLLCDRVEVSGGTLHFQGCVRDLR